MRANTAAVERSLFDLGAKTGRITAMPPGEVVELVEANHSDRVWVRWQGSVWSISLDAWISAEPL